MKNLAILFFFLFLNVGYTQKQLDNEKALVAFWDEQVQPQIDQNNIAGATISIIQNGEVRFQKGYGYADIANKVKVDGENTLFRVASISKLFVWVAIMQLYEEGKLDLNDEITKHLPDLNIPNNYPQKITIKHLMSHCAGFEDEYGTLMQNESSSLKPIVDILRKEMPSQVRPPATYSSYSNHGTGMAAHIVENIAGMGFNDYVEKEILKPLNMNHATFRQPIPSYLKAYNSIGYKKVDGKLIAQGFEFVPLYPVGGASISGGDISKFMQMLLNHGRLRDAVIMDSNTSQLMATPSHQHHPLVNPMRHGFMDMSQNGLTIYGHGGDLFYHHSTLALIPEHNLGVFISVNTDVSFPGFHNEVFRAFIDAFFPEKVEKITPPPITALAPFEGSYAMNRYSYDDALKVGKLMGIIEMEITEEGYIKTVFGDATYHWVQQDDLIFRDAESSEMLVFERDKNGKIKHAFVGGMPTAALDKLTGIDTPFFHQSLMLISAITFFSVLVYCFFTSFIKKKNIINNTSKVAYPNRVKQIIVVTSIGVLLFNIGIAELFSRGTELVYGIPSHAYLIFSLPFLIIGLTVILFYNLVKIWANNDTLALWKKGGFTFIFLCLVACIFQWNYWNLIGFNF